MPSRDYDFRIDPNTLIGTLTVPTAQRVAQKVAEQIAHDHDGKVRAALIGLGWTPPDDMRPTQTLRIYELETLLRRIDNVIIWEITPLGREFQGEIERVLGIGS